MGYTILIVISHLAALCKDLVILETVLKPEETNPGTVTVNALKLSGKDRFSILWTFYKA